MRELKFRAWNTASKEMFSAEEMGRDQLTILPNTGEFVNVHSADTRLSQTYPLTRMIPMQYTGLKDKNGVEIYEGDIVSYYPGDIRPQQVIWNDENAGFEDSNGVNLLSGRYYEVIGNIYENPEMIGLEL